MSIEEDVLETLRGLPPAKQQEVLHFMRSLQPSQISELAEEFLVGLSMEELHALASCKLALVDQTRLDDLVGRNAESSLSADEIAELDDLLVKADQLTILKTRARYTLKHLKEGRTAA